MCGLWVCVRECVCVCVTCVDEMDVNKDGKISLTEFQAGLAREFEKTEVVFLKFSAIMR